jgi:immune inhibitor A
MRLTTRACAAVLAAATLVGTAAAQESGIAQLEEAVSAAAAGGNKGDDRKHPRRIKQDKLRQKGLEEKLRGNAPGKVKQIARGQYVELVRESVDRIFVLVVEFGDLRYPNPVFADSIAGAPASNAQRFDGPLHNEIPQPDRTVDNTTLWKADYDTAHYEDMYFNRMARYYERQSANRYSVQGAVAGWVRVPFNQALYGRNYCGDIVCNTSKALVRDALAVWVQGELASGKSLAQVAAYLRTFDVWDRYDGDGDGNFSEPDGFIDHFQIVHAGGDEAAGDPVYGTDAIWSHRSYANLQAGGPGGFVGVNVGSRGGLVSSSQVPNNPTGVWVGDYTIQPENGGLGVFAHEYGHDLGLPDLYDTSGNTGGAENSTAFWSLMSSGANIGDGGPNGIGDAPVDLGAWEKFQLGWLGCASCQGGLFYGVAQAGAKSQHTLGPNDAATKKSQAVFVVLPDKVSELVVFPPAAGAYAFWSTMGDNMSTSMTRLGVSGTQLTAQVRYEIETDWDYAFLEASTNGGATWLPVSTNLSDTSGDQSGFNSSQTGITGFTAGYVTLSATLPAGTNAIRFRYQTDPAVTEKGFMIDDIAVGGVTIGNAESAAEGWSFAGFVRSTGVEEQSHFNAYVAEARLYDGYDASLRTAYNFGFLDSRPDWVETHPYQEGLLVSYWDTSFGDNNVGDHPGGGLILPVDAHPAFYHTYDGHLVRPRVLTFDSAFSQSATPQITVHKNSVPVTIPSRPAEPVFNDLRDYWFATDSDMSGAQHVGRYQPGWYGVRVPKTGTTIRVKNYSKQGKFLHIEVGAAK